MEQVRAGLSQREQRPAAVISDRPTWANNDHWCEANVWHYASTGQTLSDSERSDRQQAGMPRLKQQPTLSSAASTLCGGLCCAVAKPVV